MSCYISSNNERIYVALETSYGAVPAITGENRIPLVKLRAKQVPEQTSRRDKTGSRTFLGLPNTIRQQDEFSAEHVHDGVDGPKRAAEQGPLFQAAMGGTPVFYTGGTVASVTGQTQIAFTARARVECRGRR